MKQLAAKRSPALALGLGLALVISVAAGDYWRSPELYFSIFYLVPVAVATWIGGKRIGVGISLISAATVFAVDILSGTKHSHPYIPVWNAFMELGFFLIVALLLAAVRDEKERLEEAVRQRTAALSAENTERKRAEEQLR